MEHARGKRVLTKSAFPLVILSFLLSTGVSILSLQVMSHHNAREMNKVLATQVYDYISTEISGPIMAARTMACNSYLVDELETEAQTSESVLCGNLGRYLSGVESGVGYHSSFVISDATKRYYTRDGYMRTVDPESDPEDAWYAEFMASKAQYDLDVDADQHDKSSLIVYVNVKVSNTTKKVLGICGVGVRMTGIQELFRTYEKGFGVKIDLVDPSGMVMVDTNTANIGTEGLANLIDGNTSGEYVYSDLGGGRFVMTKYVDDLGWYLVVRSDGGSNAGQYANIILLNVVLCAFVLGALMVALHFNRRRTNELASASLTDHPTGLRNKRAFEQDKAELLAHGASGDLVCMTADLNGLKRVNDNLGHEAGDELIRGAADCLQACFGAYGAVYRIGGDEFCALLHMSDELLEDARCELERATAAWEGEMVDELSLSCGYASAREFPHASVSELCKISDERMYEDKERYYARTGITRRK